MIYMTSKNNAIMKSYLDLVNDCDQLVWHAGSITEAEMLVNRFPPNRDTSFLYKFMINGYDDCCFGYMLETIVDTFTWPECWKVDRQMKTVKLLGRSLEERNQQMNDTLVAEREKGSLKVLGGWANEVFSVYGPNKELALIIERAGAPLFGIVTYGVQLLAYQEDLSDGAISIWIARRAKTKRTYPSMFDSTVGGSLPTGETPFQCLIRESGEEASFPEELVVSSAKACGTVNYVCRTDERSRGEHGLFTPEVQFTYEMKLPRDVVPTPGDNEAEEITLLSIEQLKTALGNGDFTPANGCIVLDFFIRRGLMTYENEKNYVEIASRLHRSLAFPTA